MGIKKLYGQALMCFKNVAGLDAAKKLDTWLRYRRRLNLKSPTTLADKVSYIEMHDQSPLATECSDKFAVRQFVARKGYEHTLVPLAGGVWNKVAEIDFNALPNSCVIKATHGYKMNYFITDKAKLDIEECKKRLNKWLNTTFGIYTMEPHYIKIPHRLYAEEYLGDMTGLVDYKFHCLNGKATFVLTVSDRIAREGQPMQATLNLYDMQWNPIDGLVKSNLEVPGNWDVPRPKHFDEMHEMVEKLAEEFQFVRVDLYEWNGHIYFGEMTFSPACCVFPYFKDDFNLRMGRMLYL